MVQGDAVGHQPVDEHIIRRIFKDPVVTQISVEPFQQCGQGIFAVCQQLVFSGETVDIHKHLDPDQRIGGVEHPSVPVAQQFCGAPDIESRQTKITEGKGGHQRFDVIVAGAGQKLAMPGTVQMDGLAAVFQGVNAGVQDLVQLWVGGGGPGAGVRGIVGGDQGQGENGILFPRVLCFHPQAACAVELQSQIASAVHKGVLLRGALFLQLPAPDRCPEGAGDIGRCRQVTGIDLVKGQKGLQLLTRWNHEGASLQRHHPGQGAGRNGGGFAMPDIHDGLGGNGCPGRQAVVIAAGGGVGRQNPDGPAAVGTDHGFRAVSEADVGRQEEAAPAMGMVKAFHRHHPHLGVEGKVSPGESGYLLCRQGHLRGIVLRQGDIGIEVQKVASGQNGAVGDGIAVAEQGKSRIAAEAQLHFGNGNGETVGPFKGGNRIVGLLVFVCPFGVAGGLMIGIQVFRQPDPLFHRAHGRTSIHW